MYLRFLGALLVAFATPLMMAPGEHGCGSCFRDLVAEAKAASSETFYGFPVTAGRRYDIILRPSAGDPDLYSRAGSPVSQSQFDCRPYLSGSAEEVCTITPTSSGTQYVMVHVYSGPADWNLWVIEGDEGCHSGSPGDDDHCSASCRCGYELGDCDSDSDCAGGLSCVSGVGPSYGYSSTVDVCL
jgi:hypothetical protein